MAWAHETGTRDPVRDSHEYYCVPPVPDAHGLDWRFSVQPAGGHDGGPGLLAPGVDDVHSAAWLLLAASAEEAGTVDRRAAHARILRRLLQACWSRHPLAMGCPRSVARFSRLWRVGRFETEEPVFSRGCPILVLRRCLAAQ